MNPDHDAPVPSDVAEAPRELLTSAQLADYFQCTAPTVKAWLKRGLFPNAFKIGVQWRIPLADARAFAQKQAGQTTPSTDPRSQGYTK